jgi:TonB-linked SusC/RagA family outer membrane protein
MKRKVLLLFLFLFIGIGLVNAQVRSVTGTVTSDEDGSPVAGATILVKGTTIGVVTDMDGKFTLNNVPADAKTLVISYIGMESQEAAVKPKMNIFLKTNQEMLDEVMVVAYGTAKRSAFTGAAVEMKAADIDAHVVTTATSALAGKVAGVQATSSSGAPGSAPTIRIRGIGSMSASSAPLYIVDGAPYDGNIAEINAQDIESMSVLKDASASAIYGARGANGVVIITTKHAKQGQDAQVKLDAKWGANSRLVPQYKVISDPAQYYETHFKAMYNSKLYNGSSPAESYAFATKNLFNQNNGGLGYQVYTVPAGENLIGTNLKLNPNATLGYSDGNYYYTPDDWYDETFHNSLRQEYNLSVSGATDRLTYYASGGYLDDGGMVNNSEYKRYTARTNVDYQAKKWLKLTTDLSYARVDNQTVYTTDSYGSSGNLFYIANSMGPIYPLYVRNADGSIKTDNGRTVYDSNQTGQQRPSVVGNAIRDNEYNDRNRLTDVFNGKWSAVITPIKGLSLTATLSEYNYNSRYTYLQSAFSSAASVDGAATVTASNLNSFNQQYLANYSKTWNDVHNFSALVGYEAYKYTSSSLDGYNDHLYDPFVVELGNALGSDNKTVSSSKDRYMTQGYLARLQYDYAERYFVSASYRRDASSVFAPGHRWGDFGSVGLAWQLNKEAFLKDVDWIDLLKAKVSYGEQGNDGILGSDGYRSYYAYADRYSTSYNSETGEYSISMVQKGNEDLTWETSKAWNLGVDFTLFKGRLNGTVDYYSRKTIDMLYYKTLPLSSGISVDSYPANVGSMRNRGVEITLDGVVFKNKEIEVSLNANLTHNVNKILSLDPSIAEDGLKYSSRIIRVGGTIYTTYMKKYAGVDPETGKGLYYMDATDEQGNTYRTTTTDITKATRYECGTTLPKAYGGFGITVSGYGFDLSAQFAYQWGGQMYDGGYQQAMHFGVSAGNVMHKDLLNAWTPENTNTNIPRLVASSNEDPLGAASQTPLDFFLTKSDYLSLNNLTVGYTLPKSWTKKVDLSNIRLYFAGENLFLLTKRQGMDPRYNYGAGSMTSGSGVSNGAYTAMRNVTGGITVTF